MHRFPSNLNTGTEPHCWNPGTSEPAVGLQSWPNWTLWVGMGQHGSTWVNIPNTPRIKEFWSFTAPPSPSNTTVNDLYWNAAMAPTWDLRGVSFQPHSDDCVMESWKAQGKSREHNYGIWWEYYWILWGNMVLEYFGSKTLMHCSHQNNSSWIHVHAHVDKAKPEFLTDPSLSQG